jgi:hypothetical protein
MYASDPVLIYKKAASSQAPIFFENPGLKPDVCFKVFDREFDITSMTLKLKSEFFRTFSQPSGGKTPCSTNPSFTSEWFTAPEAIYESWVQRIDPLI